MDVKNTTNIGTVKIVMLKGEAGNSIANIEKTSETVGSEIYTITLTDGSTTTIEVEKGRGIASIEKTATEGLVDTYTITFTDDTTETFDIINGQSYTVPTDGVIYYNGSDIPEGFEETTPPSGQGAEIDDTAPSLSKVYSSAKVDSFENFLDKMTFSHCRQQNVNPFVSFGNYYLSTTSSSSYNAGNSLSHEKIDFTNIDYLEIIVLENGITSTSNRAFIYLTETDENIRNLEYPNVTDNKVMITSVGTFVFDTRDINKEMFFGICAGTHTRFAVLIKAHYADSKAVLYSNGTLSNTISLTGFYNDTPSNLLTYNHTQSAGTDGTATGVITFSSLNYDKIKIKGRVKAYTNDGSTDGTTGAEYVDMSLKVGWNTTNGEEIPITIDNTEHTFEKEFNVSDLTGGNIIFFDTVDNSDPDTTAVNAIIEVNVSEIKAY